MSTDLLKPRYKLEIRYPHYPFDGDVLLVDSDGELFHEAEGYPQSIYKILEKDITDNPCFRLMGWWEEREESDMPEYVKWLDVSPLGTEMELSGHIEKVEFYEHKRIKAFKVPSQGNPIRVEYFLPATKEEYDQFINSKKP